MKNITLKDGTVADVRIIQDGDAIFYIPFSWYEWDNAHYNSNDPYQNGSGRYQPHVTDGECPGVVHRGPFSYVTPLVDPGLSGIPPNFSSESVISQVNFFKADKRSRYIIEKVQEDLRPFGINHQAFIRVGGEFYAVYTIYHIGYPNRWVGPDWDQFVTKVMARKDWRETRDEVRKLFRWLQTPPRARDNGLIFRFGRRSTKS